MQAASVVVNGAETSDYQGFLQVSGTFNYFVCIEIKRSPGTTNSSIVVTAFTKSNKNIAIAVKYQWFHMGANPLKDRSGLNRQGSHYQLSSIDLNRRIEIIVQPHEEGFSGQCSVVYGPIQLEKNTQDMLAKCISSKAMDLPCEGKGTKGNFLQFGAVRGNKDEILFLDQFGGHQIGKMVFSKGLRIEQSQSDNNLVTISDQGTQVNIKTLRSGDRDVLVMFSQYMIKRKVNGELQLKNNQAPSPSNSNPSRVIQQNPDHSMSLVQDFSSQPKSAYKLITDNRYDSGTSNLLANVYQSQYVDQSAGRHYSQGPKCEGTSKLMNSSLYLADSASLAYGVEQAGRATPTYGPEKSYTSLLGGLLPERARGGNLYISNNQTGNSSVREVQ